MFPPFKIKGGDLQLFLLIKKGIGFIPLSRSPIIFLVIEISPEVRVRVFP
jgi:hypothetical protein